jgi:lipopolysaccharide transport system permease protein
MQASPLLIIEAGKTERHYWRDLWRYRELFYFLAWRDILVRYKQTTIGILWALLRPGLTMLAFTFVFAKLAKLPAGDTPYPVFVLVGLLPWLFFANAFTEAGHSLVSNANLISKVYFPRLIVPGSAIFVSFVDFLITGTLLLALMFWYGITPSEHILALPAFMLLTIALTLGLSLWISALNVKYRDFRYVIPFINQFGLYISPVGFSSDLVPEHWRLIFALNPMVSVIDGFRWSLLPEPVPLRWDSLGLSAALITFLLTSGILYFRRMERSFADVI